MKANRNIDLGVIRKNNFALKKAIEKGCSTKWVARLWSRYVKTRDSYRCLCCESNDRIEAHHVIRKTLYPSGCFETGNGITLCSECHRKVHAEFNGRPDLSLPLGAEQGDDQDEWAFLFGLLYDDATRRGLDEDEFYFLGDHVLDFSVCCQGYEEFRELVLRGEMSRLRFAHEIWRLMPKPWYTNLISTLLNSD